MDVDELYVSDEFKAARDRVYQHRVTHSACSIYDYTISPVYRHRDVARYAVPFIFKLDRTSRLTSNHHMPCHVDPLRALKFNPSRHKFWYFNDVTMHHMTGIRADYATKMQNTITNASESGRQFVLEWWQKHVELKQLSEDELLATRDDLGGYIKVDDRFGLLNRHTSP